jgi:hypothetical protein
MRRPLAIIQWPRRHGDTLTLAQYILTRMRESPLFPDPPVPYDVVETHVTAAESAEVTTLLGYYAATSARDAALFRMKGVFEALKMYVQTLADRAEGVNAAQVVIVAAGMRVKNSQGPTRAAFQVKQGPISGMVILLARSVGRRAKYEWQWSLDGQTWTSAPDTLVAETTLTGLTRAKLHYFRCKASSRKVPGDWSQVLSLLVV